jgi:hypothetical protein
MLIKTLDPDPLEMSDPYKGPDSIDPDPQHWLNEYIFRGKILIYAVKIIYNEFVSYVIVSQSGCVVT